MQKSLFAPGGKACKKAVGVPWSLTGVELWGRLGMGMAVRFGRGRLASVSVAAGLLFAGLFGAVAIGTAGVSVAQPAQTRIDI